MAEPTEFSAYIVFKVDENGRMRGFKIAATLEEAEGASDEDGKSEEEQPELFTHQKVDEAAEEAAADVKEEDRGIQGALKLYMNRMSNDLSQYHELTEISSYIRPVLVSSYVDEHIYEVVKASGRELRRSDETISYALSAGLSEKVYREMSRARETDAGLTLLPSSILLSLVATFDSLVGDLFREILKFKPERLQNSDKTISYKDLFAMRSFDDAMSRIIDDEVDKLLRGNHEGQVEYFEKLIDTRIVARYSRWGNFIEIFERRNRVAHASGIIGDAYIKRCADLGLDTKHLVAGKKFPLRAKYLHKCIDILTEFGVLLAFVAWRKLESGSSARAYQELNQIAYIMIRKRRYDLASWLLDFALYKQPRLATESITRMMAINLANVYKNKNRGDLCSKTMNDFDWSASSDNFKISIAALNEDVEEVVRLLPQIARTGDIKKGEFREWPIFDWVRSDQRVLDAFKEVYGEPLLLEVEDNRSNSNKDEEGIIQSEARGLGEDG